MRKILSIFLTIISVTVSWAQNEFTLNNMDHIFQSTYVNQTAMPDHKVSFGLPGMSGVYGSFGNSGFALKDVISTDGVNWNINALKNQIANRSNYMYTGANVDLFHLRIKIKRTYLSFTAASKNNMYFAYPESFGRAALLNTRGSNGDGESIDLSGLGIDQTSYMEYGVGLSTFLKNFIIGGRLKLLQGINNFSLSSDNLSLGVDKNLYDLSFKGNSTLHTNSELENVINNGFNSSTISNIYNFKNLGFGGDFAVTYLYRKNITFSVAVNNIGFINWKSNAKEYNLVDANTKFSGLDILPSVFAGKDVTGISVTDSTADNLKPKANSINSYTTWLAPNSYFTGRYYVTQRLMFSASIMLEYYKMIRFGAALGGQYKLGRLFSLTGTASYQYSDFNLGAGIVFKPGPFQLYVVADNFLSIETAFRAALGTDGQIHAPTNSRAFNLRAGINFVFGREHLNEQQALNK